MYLAITVRSCSLCANGNVDNILNNVSKSSWSLSGTLWNWNWYWYWNWNWFKSLLNLELIWSLTLGFDYDLLVSFGLVVLVVLALVVVVIILVVALVLVVVVVLVVTVLVGWWRVVNGLAVRAVSGGFSGELVVVVVGATLAGLIQMLMHYANVQLSVS